MASSYDISKKAAEYLKVKLILKPQIALILGSGLGSFTNEIQDSNEILFKDVPGLSEVIKSDHEGKFVCGIIEGKCVIAMKGRFHYYEGFDISQVVLPIRVLKLIGVDKLIVTNAAGGINKLFEIGDLMLITDHLSFFLPSPLRGKNDDEFGTRFPDMSRVYSREFIAIAKNCASELDINIKQGIYAYMQGPMYETPAEIRALSLLGADAVGMSTVPEVITAVHASMKVIGISCITNMASGIIDRPLSHIEVIKTAKEIEQKFGALVKAIVGKM